VASPMFTASVDSQAVIAMLGRVGPSSDYVCREVARDTAKRIVAEAKARVRRATGATESGIHWELTRDGKGYVVLAYRAGAQTARVDYLLQYGSVRMYAKPWFFSSAYLEEGPHMRRLEEALRKFLEDVGR
jgi:hypothetical protein